MKHIWTYREDYVIAQQFIEITVLGRKAITMSEFAERNQICKGISVNSIKMKAQNIKGYLEEKNINSSAKGATLKHSSRQCRKAVDDALQHYKMNLAAMGIYL